MFQSGVSGVRLHWLHWLHDSEADVPNPAVKAILGPVDESWEALDLALGSVGGEGTGLLVMCAESHATTFSTSNA